MNRAIFKFSFFDKFNGIIDWLVLAGFVLGPAVSLILVALNIEQVDYRYGICDQVFHFATDSTYLMLLTFIFVSDGLVGRRIIGDAAPLSIVFARPITRLSYVFSKWCAGALGSACMLILAGLVFQLAVYGVGVKETYLDGYAAVSMILNCMGYAALMTFLHCLPGVFGPFIYLSLISITNIGNLLAAAPDKGIPWYAIMLKQAAVGASYWLSDFIYPTIDVFTLLTSVVFDWNSLIVFTSSIVIFLVSGALIMVRREFFYATD